MSGTYTVTVNIDVANQTVTASDSIITVPTSNFDIVTFDNKSCIKPNTNISADFDFSASSVVGFTCKIFLQAVNSFTLFCGVRDVNNTLYSLVYYPYGYWYNPDNATFDPNNDLVGTWVTVTYSSSAKTLSFDNGTTVLTRVLADLVNQLSMVKFNEYDVYLTDLEFEVSTPSSKYLDGTGLSEVWTNTKNYISAQLLGKSDVGHTHVKNEITDFPTLATVATSGSYNDLSDKPIIPDVSNYYTKAEVDALISNAGISPSANTLFIGEPYSLVNSAETNLGNYEEVSND